MEQLLWLQHARRQAFRMMPAQKHLQHMPVRLQPVRPEIVAHQLPCRMQLLVDEWQRHFGGGRIGQFGEARFLRLLERLEHGARKPRMPLGKLVNVLAHV